MKKSLVVIFITLTLLITNIAYAEELKTFSDLSNSHWAYEYIMNLVKTGTLKGYEDNTFKPEKSITRAEAQKILVSEFYPSTIGTSVDFGVDIDKSHWAYDYYPRFACFVEDDDDKSLRPNDVITRAEFSEALVKATNGFSFYSYSLGTFGKERASVAFSDISKDDKNFDAIYCLNEKGIIAGYEDGTFKPNESLTRAQVCKMVDLSLKLLEEKAIHEMEFDNIELASYHPELIHIDNESFLKGGKNNRKLYHECVRDSLGRILAYSGAGKLDETKSKYVPQIEYSLYKNGEKQNVISDNIVYFSNTPTYWRYTDKSCVFDTLFDIQLKNDAIKLNYSYYIPEKEFLDTINKYTNDVFDFKHDDYSIVVGKDNFECFVSDKIVNDTIYLEAEGISSVLNKLYKDYNWSGPTKETIEKLKTEYSNSTNNLIPSVSNSSFAFLGNRHNEFNSAFEGDVGINYIYDEKTPIYLKLIKTYKGEEAKKVIDEYNSQAEEEYDVKPNENLYILLFDIDLKDFSPNGNEDYINYFQFMRNPMVVYDLLKDSETYVYARALPLETKTFYKKGDITQMICVFQTDRNVDYTYVKFINDDDFSFETFFVNFE